MDVIRAIPKKLLGHTVVYAKSIDTDRWGKEVLKDKLDLKFVQMEPSSKIIRDKNGAEVQLAATMFYDCRNSRPKGLEFVTDDIVLYHGQKHLVQIVEPLYEGKRLHHYELGLIRRA